MNIETIKQAVKEAQAKLRGKVAAFASKVYPIYQKLGWTWACGDYLVIPTPTQVAVILTRLISLLDSACLIQNDPPFASFYEGGLVVWLEFKEQDVWECGMRMEIDETIYFEMEEETR